jgi:hypothetical protein
MKLTFPETDHGSRRHKNHNGTTLNAEGRLRNHMVDEFLSYQQSTQNNYELHPELRCCMQLAPAIPESLK